MDAAIGLAMRGQHQRVRRHACEAVERGEILGERVAQRLRRPDRDIGRDARQQDVAAHERAQRRAPEAGMLGRVPPTDDHLPLAGTELQDLAVSQSLFI